ncbi:MAG TPA: hypothetical protein VGG34_11355 [Opitutaceae bacterium]
MAAIRHVLPLVALATALRADPLGNARRAEEMLGPGVWTRLIRVTNTNPGRPYPARVHALVFELSGILWFYTDTDGTQSLSTHLGTLERDKADFSPLLPAIDRGFASWRAEDPGRAPPGEGRIPNGCFIESVSLLRRRLEAGGQASRPRLLSYYVRVAGRVRGHTVLQFMTDSGPMVLDPDAPARPVPITPADVDDAESCVGCLRGDVFRARWLPLGDAFRGSGRPLASAAAGMRPRG